MSTVTAIQFKDDLRDVVSDMVVSHPARVPCVGEYVWIVSDARPNGCYREVQKVYSDYHTDGSVDVVCVLTPNHG